MKWHSLKITTDAFNISKKTDATKKEKKNQLRNLLAH